MERPAFYEPVKDAYLYCVAAQKNHGPTVEVRTSTMLQVFPEIQTSDSVYQYMNDFAMTTFPLDEGWHSHSLIPTRLQEPFIQQYFRTTHLKRKK